VRRRDAAARGEQYRCTPCELIAHPDQSPDAYARVMAPDLAYPMDIMGKKGRWLMLDGSLLTSGQQ
jgi:hypothetical protein